MWGRVILLIVPILAWGMDRPLTEDVLKRQHAEIHREIDTQLRSMPDRDKQPDAFQAWQKTMGDLQKRLANHYRESLPEAPL